jgi:hypothetical protein
VDKVDLAFIHREHTKGDKTILQYVEWRRRALSLANILAVATVCLVSLKLDGQVTVSTDAKMWCEKAWVVEDFSQTTSAARRLAALNGTSSLGRTAADFPSDKNYSSADEDTCHAHVKVEGTDERSSLMGDDVPNHRVVIDGSSFNLICGDFVTTCAALPLQGFTNATACNQSTTLSQQCGWQPNPFQCLGPKYTDLQRATEVGDPLFGGANCVKAICAAPGPCQAGPCPGRFWCGQDALGEVCAGSLGECAAAAAGDPSYYRAKRIKISLTQPDGTFGRTEQFYSSRKACEEGFRYSPAQYSRAAAHEPQAPTEPFPTDLDGPLLYEEISTGTVQFASADQSSIQLLPQAVLADEPSNWLVFNRTVLHSAKVRIKDMFGRTYRLRQAGLSLFSDGDRRLSSGSRLSGGRRLSDDVSPVRLQVLAHCKCNKVEYATVVAGAAFPITNTNCTQTAGMFAGACPFVSQNVAMPEYPMLIGFDEVTSSLVNWQWDGVNPAEQTGTSIDIYLMQASCCSLPFTITSMTGEVGTALKANGAYSALTDTLSGRPVYFGKNLGPTGRGLFLFFFLPRLSWYIGVEWPNDEVPEHFPTRHAPHFPTPPVPPQTQPSNPRARVFLGTLSSHTTRDPLPTPSVVFGTTALFSIRSLATYRTTRPTRASSA